MELLNKYETMVALRVSTKIYNRYITNNETNPPAGSFDCPLCLLQMFRNAETLINWDRRRALPCGDCPLFDNIDIKLEGHEYGPMCCKEWKAWHESPKDDIKYIVAIYNRLHSEIKKIEETF